MILTFEDGEDEILNHIISYVSTGTGVFQSFVSAKKNLIFSGLEIDITKRLVKKQQEEIILTFTEFEILLLLAQNAGIIFSKEQIYEAVFGYDGTADDTAVTQHIKNIRAKLRTAGVAAPETVLKTIWGVGYQWKSET